MTCTSREIFVAKTCIYQKISINYIQIIHFIVDIQIVWTIFTLHYRVACTYLESWNCCTWMTLTERSELYNLFECSNLPVICSRPSLPCTMNAEAEENRKQRAGNRNKVVNIKSWKWEYGRGVSNWILN